MNQTWCRALTTHLSARGRSARASRLLKSAPARSCHSRSSSCSRLNRMNLPAFHSLLVKLRLDTKLSMDRFRSWPAVVPALVLAEVSCCMLAKIVNQQSASAHSTDTQVRQTLNIHDITSCSHTHFTNSLLQGMSFTVCKLYLAGQVHLTCYMHRRTVNKPGGSSLPVAKVNLSASVPYL